MHASLFAIALLLPAAAQAQDRCPADAEPVPAALSAWRAGAALDAAALVDAAPALAIGLPAELSLHPLENVELAVVTDGTAKAGKHGGMVAFTVERAGTYRVALSTPGWIEVFAAGKGFTSSGHGHGPRCSGIRKIVDFTLGQGRYILQISGNPASTARVLIVAADGSSLRR